MGLAPKIEKRKSFLKTCNKCGETLGSEEFAQTPSLFYPDGRLPVCNSCINEMLGQDEYNWGRVDKVCQYADIPFIPKEWTKILKLDPQDPFGKYAELMVGEEYQGIAWEDYFREFQELEKQGGLVSELPLLAEERRQELRTKWGSNYDDEALLYLENLYSGLCATQNVAGAIQIDQALKICKMSYEIDSRIRSGTDFDKILSAYDKTIKTAEFTPKSAKNAGDFESVGELFRWLERRGWKNQFYDGVTKDVVDETIKNIQSFNRRLYTEESSISEEITRRVEALKTADQLENNYYVEGDNSADDLDKYENDGYEKLYSDEEFEVEVEDDG